jgi:hypothetical protein
MKKRNKIITYFVALFTLLIFNTHAYSDELFFTYLGLNFTGGLNKINYTDWIDDQHQTKKDNGKFYSGGPLFNVYVKNLIGDFRLNYVYNKNKLSETTVSHLNWSGSLKYAYPLTKSFSLTSGLGLYLETPPSSKKYDGSGVLVSIGSLVTINWDWKLSLDFHTQYGHFGIGESSRKLSYGASLGILRKVGKR